MKLRRISLAVLSVLLSAIAALSGFMIYTQLSDRQKEKEEFDTLAEMAEVTPEKPTMKRLCQRMILPNLCGICQGVVVY